MASSELFHAHHWYPLAPLGITADWAAVNADTVIYTWITLGIITALSIAARFALRNPTSKPGFLVLAYVDNFVSSLKQSCESAFLYRFTPFITVLFTFLILCNCLIVIPGLEEPTNDLNTTIALAIISFLFIQKEMLTAHGLAGYIQEYMVMPLALEAPTVAHPLLRILVILGKALLNIIIGLCSLPLELISKLSTVVSLAFRLFGNIVAGSFITTLWRKLMAGSLFWGTIGLSINLVIIFFFGFFEGFIQAFVFTTLTVTYLAMAVRTGFDDETAENIHG